MKTIALALASLGVAAAAIPATANAAPAYQGGYQGWQSINQRQTNLYQRIDQGIRSGALNRNEAYRLKTQFNGLVRLEAQYRRGGLNAWERNDLNNRFDVLSSKIRFQKHDRQHRR